MDVLEKDDAVKDPGVVPMPVIGDQTLVGGLKIKLILKKPGSSHVGNSYIRAPMRGALINGEAINVNTKSNQTPSFVDVVQEKSSKKVVKISKLHNDEVVEEAAVVIPLVAVEEVISRFINTLYDYFIGKRLAFPLVENYVKNTWVKFGLRRVQLHENFFLFQFDTKEGMDNVIESGPWLIRGVPLFLKVWNPSILLKKDEIKNAPIWVKLDHVPIGSYSEIGLSDKDLLESIVIAIPKSKGEGHTLATIKIEYEWRPPHCSICKHFEHMDKHCPTIPKETEPVLKTNTDDFTKVKRRKRKGKKSAKPRQINGVRMSKPPPSYYYHRVEKGESFKANDENKLPSPKLAGISKTSMPKPNEAVEVINASDSDEVDQKVVLEDSSGKCIVGTELKGASAPIDEQTGLQFTWNQKPKGTDGILKKLDRIMENLVFNDVFMGAHAIFKPYRISDHSPVVLNIPAHVKVKPKPFKFSNILTQHVRFKEVVYEGWSMELDKVQTDLDVDPFNSVLRGEEAAYVQAFNDALVLEERFLKQKAKIAWLREGDSNSACFHKVVKGRVSRSRIDVVTNADAILLIDTSNLFQKKLDDATALAMIRGVSAREVKEAMFSMGNDKSPRSDGYTAEFFKDVWDIMGSNVTKAELMHNYHLDRGVPRCAFKVDIQKAYDTVDLEFIRQILGGFGFHDRMITWIMECVTSTSFSPSINGSLHGFFKGKRGLRQDDMFLFAYGDTHSTRVIMESLDEFKLVSGLIASLPKSSGMRKGKAKVAWEIVCLPKEEGGLGIQRIYRCEVMVRDTPSGLIVGVQVVPLLLLLLLEIFIGRVLPYLQRHSFNLWLIFKKLKTQDLLRSWDDTGLLTVWANVKVLAGLQNSGSSFNSNVSIIRPLAKRRTSLGVIAKLVFAASAYFIWQERNGRLFKKTKRSTNQVVECVMTSFRLKLLSCRFKKSRDSLVLMWLWNIRIRLFNQSDNYLVLFLYR
ncbi:putative reverse transcriptase domain-containing protein [Tanacetum coccineum]